jgi:hypothetical protein
MHQYLLIIVLQKKYDIKRIKKVHEVGSSKVVTLDPDVIKKLKIDNWTFLLQEPVENGILMKIMRLDEKGNEG